MKNIELINLLSLGNVILTPNYNQNETKIKLFDSEIKEQIINNILIKEDILLDSLKKISLSKRKTVLINYINIMKSFNRFTFKQINYLLKLKLFNNEQEKNNFSYIYETKSKVLNEYKSMIPKRKRRAILSEYQQDTIKSWLDKIKKFTEDIDKTISYNKSSSNTFKGVGLGGTISLFGALAATPFTGGISLILSSGAFVSLGVLLYGITYDIENKQLEEKKNKLYKLYDELEQILRRSKYTDNKTLEQEFKEKIKEIIFEINSIEGIKLNMDELNFESKTEKAFHYIISNGY
ncbi:hypothetical protein RRG40_04555 [Mycoplasmopsis felis]|uniref:hypothetical protein n=1 Tax=Mycoplasmopsis felis TaxID=33923 RepID=UPI002AFE9395|nr:hypothetical protein [Mycoplasmopsis felis]WQQ05460.1 hypothetical protein RRG59_03875 [Mycoplasmopsis felis]